MSDPQYTSAGQPGTDLPAGPVRGPVSKGLMEAAAVIAERMLTVLAGRAYSPRIRLLDINQVCECMNLSVSQINAMVKARTFPQPQRGLGKRRWRESALIAWADANDPNQEK